MDHLEYIVFFHNVWAHGVGNSGMSGGEVAGQ